MKNTITRRTAFGLGAGLLAAPAIVSAQGNWPTGPIRFIGLFPPGGGTDILSRIWCIKMSEMTGQQFVVENRSGSGGNVGTEAIARSTPDGNTIGLASVAPLAISPTLYTRLNYNPARDIALISGLWQLPNMLVVNNDVPARTVPELIALLKANPGKYAFASSGSGTTVHLSGEMFKFMAGVDMLHVPYRGAAPAHIDLAGGRVHMIFDNIPQALALARDGKVRANDALNILKFSTKGMADDVRKVLASAIANAENNHNLDVDSLVVAEASVGKAIMMKRFTPRARGRASRIEKPFSRLRVVVREMSEDDAKTAGSDA